MQIYWTFQTEQQYLSDHKVVSFVILLISINTVVVVIPVFEVPVEIMSAAIETCGYAIYLMCHIKICHNFVQHILIGYLSRGPLHGTRADREQFQKTLPEDLAYKAVDEEVQGTGK